MSQSKPWGKENVSYSMSCSTWGDCRQKFAYKYIQRIPEQPGIWAPQGTTIHNALYDFHQNPEIEMSDLEDMMHGYFDEEIEGKDFYEWRKGSQVLMDAGAVDKARMDAIHWIRGYVESVKSGDFPLIRFSRPPEQDVEAPVDGTDLVARGHVDFFVERVEILPTGEIILRADDGRIHMGDFKSASKKFNAWNQARADIDLQPTMYGLIMGEPITFHYVVIEKTAHHEKPSIKHIITHREEKDYEKLRNMLTVFERDSDRLNGYENAVIYPEPTMSFGRFCGKMCSYKDICWKDNFSHAEQGE